MGALPLPCPFSLTEILPVLALIFKILGFICRASLGAPLKFRGYRQGPPPQGSGLSGNLLPCGQAPCPGQGSPCCPPHQIAIHTLWNIRIVVLAKPEHENRISHICTDNVKTGIANTLGEQGRGCAHMSIPSKPTGTSLSQKTVSRFLGSPQAWVTRLVGFLSPDPARVYTSATGIWLE